MRLDSELLAVREYFSAYSRTLYYFISIGIENLKINRLITYRQAPACLPRAVFVPPLAVAEQRAGACVETASIFVACLGLIENRGRAQVGAGSVSLRGTVDDSECLLSRPAICLLLG